MTEGVLSPYLTIVHCACSLATRPKNKRDERKGKNAIAKSLMTVSRAMFSVDGAFISATSELPDISSQNSTKAYQKVTKAILYLAK